MDKGTKAGVLNLVSQLGDVDRTLAGNSEYGTLEPGGGHTIREALSSATNDKMDT